MLRKDGSRIALTRFRDDNSTTREKDAMLTFLKPKPSSREANEAAAGISAGSGAFR